MTPKLTDEQRQAVEQEHGGPVRVEAEGGTYVLMSFEAYRAMMGVGSEQDFADSVAALRASMDEVRAGMTRPLTDALDDLRRRHGISR